MRTLPTFIFDLDGVITNTEDYHFDAWKSICLSLNYDLSPEKNEELKGVSRSECLDKILKWANLSLDSKEFNEILKKKNTPLVLNSRWNWFYINVLYLKSQPITYFF